VGDASARPQITIVSLPDELTPAEKIARLLIAEHNGAAQPTLTTSVQPLAALAQLARVTLDLIAAERELQAEALIRST